MEELRILFGAVSDPSKYYPSFGHETVSQKIIAGLREGESFQVVLGDLGSGKTTLAVRWLALFGKSFDTIFLPSKRYPNSSMLLQDINDQMGLPPIENTWIVRNQIEACLLSAYEKNIRKLLIVDGAHQLSKNSLMDIVSFTNIIGTNGPALSLILLGQDTLLDKIISNKNSAVIKYPFLIEKIPFLEIDELTDFARHQIRLGGLDPDKVIDSETLLFAASLANGNIGVMTFLIRLAWRFAKMNDMNSIDIELIEAANNSISRTNNQTNIKVDELKSDCNLQTIST